MYPNIKIRKTDFLKNPKFYFKNKHLFGDKVNILLNSLTKDELLEVTWLYPWCHNQIKMLDNDIFNNTLISYAIFKYIEIETEESVETEFGIYPLYLGKGKLDRWHPHGFSYNLDPLPENFDIIKARYGGGKKDNIIHKIIENFEKLQSASKCDYKVNNIFSTYPTIKIKQPDHPDLRWVIQDFPDYLLIVNRPPLSLQFLRWDSGLPAKTPEKYHNFPHFDIRFSFFVSI